VIRPYLVSLGVGTIIGAFYAAIGVRSPAPPFIALLGLLGFLIGENGYPALKAKLSLGASQTIHQEKQTKDGK